jgi:hypothetical protein
MAALTDEQKVFIVRALASYDRPKQVVEAVKQEFSLVVTPQQLQAYNPETRAGKRMSEKLRALFEDTRKGFRDGQADIAIAHRSFRLRTLQRLADRAADISNFAMTLQILEQAAKEVGDVYVNRQRSDSKDGGEQAQPTQVVMTVVDARKHDDS